jgi:hypothetical protein
MHTGYWFESQKRESPRRPKHRWVDNIKLTCKKQNDILRIENSLARWKFGFRQIAGRRT